MKKQKTNNKRRALLVTKEVAMVALALMCLAGLALEHLEKLSELQLYALGMFELMVGVLFMAEFAFELYFAKGRKKYWRHHWYFLLAGIPLPAQAFDILRGVRLLRLVRLFKIFAHLRYERNTWLFEKQKS